MVLKGKRAVLIKLAEQLNFVFWLTVFLGALDWRLLEVFWNNPSKETHIILLLLPVFAYVGIYPLVEKRMHPLALSIVAVSALFITRYIGEITSWYELAPWREEFVFPSFLVFLAFAGVELLTLISALYLRRRQSVWLLLFVMVAVYMLIFSYVDRVFSLAILPGILSALILQATIKVEEPQGLKVRDEFGGRKPGRVVWPRRRRLIWSLVILLTAFYLGFNLPAFKAVWFQGTSREVILDQLNTQLNKITGAGPIISNDEVFSWNFSDPGRSWQPDAEKPLFYVQSSKPTYWRSQVFDVYWGSGYQQWTWYNTEDDTFRDAALPLEMEPPIAPSAETSRLTGQVRVVSGLGEGVGLPLPYNTTEITGKSRKSFEYSPELQVVTTRETLSAGTTYEVEAVISTYTKEDLRKVENLPSSVPGFRERSSEAESFSDLERLTESADNPYDKIELMAEYLRNNGTYTLDPTRTSANLVADFFTTGEGYCVQFSSALALMAQDMGYPARWVVGFNEGEPLPPGATNPFPDKPRSTVRVLTQANAHSWVEIYFPGYGWIPFEATPGFSYPQEPKEKVELPEMTLPDVTDSDKSPREIERDITEDGDAKEEPTQVALVQWVLAILAGGAGITGIAYWYWRRWYARLSDRAKMQRLYRHWLRRLRFAGIKYRAEETPHEFAERTKHLGTEWKRVWNDFTRLAEEAYYAPKVDHAQFVRMQALAQRLKLLKGSNPEGV